MICIIINTGVNQVLFGRIGLGQFCIPPASIRHYYISFWWFTLRLFIGHFPSCEGSPTYCIQWIVSSIQSARTGQRLYIISILFGKIQNGGPVGQPKVRITGQSRAQKKPHAIGCTVQCLGNSGPSGPVA